MRHSFPRCGDRSAGIPPRQSRERQLLRQTAIAGLLALAAALAGCGGRTDDPLGTHRPVAPGVRLYALSDSALVDGAGPISIQALRLDPAQVRLESALANDQVMGTETVADLAARHHAIAAVNAGFFAPN